MSNVISLVRPPKPEPSKPVMFTHDDVIILMMVLELLELDEGSKGLDSRIYPQLQKLHKEFLDERGE